MADSGGTKFPQGLLPSLVAPAVQRGVADYLQTTFAFSDGQLVAALEELIAREEGGLFKGPYVSLRLPYKKPDPRDRLIIPLDVAPSFVPYLHQLRAFDRLGSRDGAPKHTLVTTGTGSGKTECFLHPILDHCFRHKGEAGIKAIILYPMNALATDQAGRIARIVAADPRLSGLRAGLYVGEDDESRHGATSMMSERSIITDRKSLRASPPDILLTNYRMLDFLLLRPDDRSLWAKNTPETLQYLVLDELHTYDGAQGSDVACLVRRIRHRLGIPTTAKGFTCVGTSATVAGDGTSTTRGAADEELLRFASTIFGVPFAADSVIGEERVSRAAWFPDNLIERAWPRDIDALAVQGGEQSAAYCARQTELWFGRRIDDAAELGRELRRHPFLQNIAAHLEKGPRSEADLMRRLVGFDPDFEDLPEAARLPALRSHLALAAWARRDDGDRSAPLLTVQIHLWLRELRRLVRVVDVQPRFAWDSDPASADGRRALPAWYCRECGESGWLSMQRRGDNHVSGQLEEIYQEWFARGERVVYLRPGHDPSHLAGTQVRIEPRGLSFVTEEEVGGLRTVPVRVHQPHAQRAVRDTRRCPGCDARALTFAGASGATLGSVAVNQLFGTRLASDRKLLAFTDSVQDASHRAGFFSGRTFRFHLRAAMLQPLIEGKPIPLVELGARTLAWSDENQGVKRTSADLCPPDLADEPAYVENRFHDGARPEQLQRMLHERLGFEAFLEFGYNARVGRTLPKTGCAALGVDAEPLHRVLKRLRLLLPEEFHDLVTIEHKDDAVDRFVLGSIHRLAMGGAVHHPWLETFAREDGNTFLLTKSRQRWIAPGMSQRAPAFATLRGGHEAFEAWGATSGRSWAHDHVLRVLSGDLTRTKPDGQVQGRIVRLLETVLGELLREDLVIEFGRDEKRSFALLPTLLHVTAGVVLLRCITCGHAMTLTATEAHWFHDALCLRYACSGRYGPETRPAQQFYRDIYRNADLQRVYGAEHTGLLQRSEREEVERGFREGAPADAPNLLAATSTLEMGIDIGDLSATLLCSVPPSVASFVQRVGRAGRTTGNSIIVTQARTRASDLYWFDEPLDMVAGAVTPPGTYLDAPEMLVRQFFAFCLDTWCRDVLDARLPRDVTAVLAEDRAGRFPARLLGFIEQHREILLKEFCGLFEGVLSDENIARIREGADSLDDRFRREIANVAARLDDLRRLRERLRERQKGLDGNAALTAEQREHEQRECREDIHQIETRQRSLRNTYTLDFLVDRGLLPNYALSEQMVALDALVTGVPSPQDKDPWSGKEGANDESHVWQRPASIALREFAPFNHFYAGGRHVVIDQVDAGSRGHSRIEQHVFCARCSWSTPLAAASASTECPDCGAPGLGETGQVRDVVRLTEVGARTPHRSSLVLDATDERERERYRTKTLLTTEPGVQRIALVDERKAFGFEWLQRVHLRELNLGPLGVDGGRMFLDGEESLAPGFHICDDCGVVEDTRVDVEQRRVRGARHLARCRGRRGDAVWRDVLLDRELQSEALRILMPVAAFDADRQVANLKAVVELGLKLRFGGDPSHLALVESSEPASGGARRRFLVIYDMVPGGTGYLKEFASKPGAFVEILELARRRLSVCRCIRNGSDDAGDGCYRCLITPRAMSDLRLLSKTFALGMLRDLLDKLALAPVPSLSDVSVAHLADSKLELLFLERFIEAAKARNFDVSATSMGGWLVHRFRRGQETLVLRPQVLVGPTHGVDISSKPDFVLERRRYADGSPSTDLPVAVFCDGFRFHAHRADGTSILDDDVAKRASLLRSGRWRVWNVTWEDMTGDARVLGSTDLLGSGAAGRIFGKMVNDLLKHAGQLAQLADADSVTSLFDLATGPTGSWPVASTAFAYALLPSPPGKAGDESWQATSARLRNEGSLAPMSSGGSTLFVGDRRWSFSAVLAALMPSAMKQPAFLTNPGAAARWLLRLDDDDQTRAKDGFRRSWRRWLHLWNLLQGVPDGEVSTTRSAAAGVDGHVSTAADGADWMADVAADVRPLLQDLADSSVPAPETLIDVLSPDKGILGQAEIAWEDARIALVHPLQAADFDLETARSEGWHVLIISKELDVKDVRRRLRGTG